MSAQFMFVIILSAVAVILMTMVIRSRRNAAASSEVYVGNLNYYTKENELKKFFSQFGKINEIKIIKNNRTGRSKGYAFIRYKTDNEANNALASHGQQFNNRALVVRIAKSQAR